MRLESVRDRVGRFGWNAPFTNRNYVIELGSVPGGANLNIIALPNNATFYIVRDLPQGTIYARVKAQTSGGTSPPSNEIQFSIPDFQDFVDALFMGTGPMVSKDQYGPQCPRNQPANPQVWSGFPRGTTVRSPVSTAISDVNRQEIERMLAAIPAATLGAINTVFELTDNPAPLATPNTMALAVAPQAIPLCDQASQGCCAPVAMPIACMHYRFVNNQHGVMLYSRGVYQDGTLHSPQPFLHEIGHGILGMCHLDDAAVGPRQSVINGSIGLSPLDVEALGAVWGSGLSPGANRADFVRAGLVKP